eukprot:11790908-Heterocapsa_arctica.AAC.1
MTSSSSPTACRRLFAFHMPANSPRRSSPSGAPPPSEQPLGGQTSSSSVSPWALTSLLHPRP